MSKQEFTVPANATIKLNSIKDATATQRFKVQRRLHLEVNPIEDDTFQDVAHKVYPTASTTSIFTVECDAFWGEKSNQWYDSKTRIETFNNPGEILVKISVDDAFGGDGDFDDLIIQFIIK